MNEKCGNCRFFDMYNNDPEEGEPSGACRRFPPTYIGPTVLMRDGMIVSDFHHFENHHWSHPPMFDSQYCGEWRPIPNA